MGGGTVVPALKGREGRQRSSRASGQRSARLSRLSLPPQFPRPGREAVRGIMESSCPAPCPLGGEGEGDGKSPARGGRGRGREMMAPTRHQETGPAAASPHAALNHSGGCDRGGGKRRKREGEALKETAAAAGTGACLGGSAWEGQGRVVSPLGEGGGLGLLGQLGGGPGPPDGPDPVSHQYFANACHFLLCRGLSTCVPQRPWGPSSGAPTPAERKRIPWRGEREKLVRLAVSEG